MARSEKISLRIDSKFYNKDVTDKTMIGGKNYVKKYCYLIQIMTNAKDKNKVSGVAKITTTGVEWG